MTYGISLRIGQVALAAMVVVLGAAGALAAAGDTSVHAPAPAARPSDEAMVKVEKEFRWDEFAQVMLVLDLRAPQLAAFKTRMTARADKLKALDEGEVGKKRAEVEARFREAQKAHDPKKVADLAAERTAVGAEYARQRHGLRTELLGSLSAEQRAYWVRFCFYRDTVLRLKAAVLTPEQKDTVWTMAAEPAGKVGDWVAPDPYLTAGAVRGAKLALLATVTEKVLSAEQRETLPKPRATTQPAK